MIQVLTGLAKPYVVLIGPAGPVSEYAPLLNTNVKIAYLRVNGDVTLLGSEGKKGPHPKP